jgi:ELWxxDGT repeat protein
MTKAVFAGFDANGELNPWVTDGTAARTSELVPNGTGLFAGVNTPDFNVLGGTTLFAGASGFGAIGLWVTDGTSGGTSELSVPGQAGGAALDDLFVGGFDPDFTVLGNKALFVGVDASVHTNLWVTDGTAAGTHELSTPTAYSGGLFVNLPDPDFTVFGTKVLFAGNDASTGIDLWVTDGTSAGTHELTVVGADPTGLFGPLEINPDFTVLGNKVLFDGSGTVSGQGLWVTDGTSVGTSELTVSGANAVGLFSNGLSPDLTVLGSKALFAGMAANGFSFVGLPNLWVTDGTSAGTTELTVAGANPSGLFSSVNPAFTVLGSKALFEGEDASGHVNLWVTDGTSAGTSELTVTGANPNGIFSSTNPDFTLLGSKVLFAGEDAAGNANLWVTDGTSAGTSELTVAGAYSGGLKPFDITPFGGSEALFQGVDASGNTNLWMTDGTAVRTSEVMVTGASAGGLTPSDITVLSSPNPPPVIMAPGLVRLALNVSAPVPGVSISVNGAGAARPSRWPSPTTP